MRFKREGSVMSADLHGASVENARDLLLTWLDHAPQSVTELRVIHGYNRGTLLRDMVREELSHPRIKEKLPKDMEQFIYRYRKIANGDELASFLGVLLRMGSE